MGREQDRHPLTLEPVPGRASEGAGQLIEAGLRRPLSGLEQGRSFEPKWSR